MFSAILSVSCLSTRIKEKKLPQFGELWKKRQMCWLCCCRLPWETEAFVGQQKHILQFRFWFPFLGGNNINLPQLETRLTQLSPKFQVNFYVSKFFVFYPHLLWAANEIQFICVHQISRNFYRTCQLKINWAWMGILYNTPSLLADSWQYRYFDGDLSWNDPWRQGKKQLSRVISWDFLVLNPVSHIVTWGSGLVTLLT